MKSITIRNSVTDFLIFSGGNNGDSIEVRTEGNSIGGTQKLRAQLFDYCTKVIRHIKMSYEYDELSKQATTKDFLVVRQKGSGTVDRKVNNLDAIITANYRANSKRTTDTLKTAESDHE